MRTALILVGFVACCAIGACLPDTSGLDPPNDELIYPVGVATVANDQFLLVANSNFDLEYNAGTLTALEISDLEAHMVNGKVSKDDKYVFIEEADLIYVDETIRLGAFASDLELTPSGDRALIPVRGERAIMVVDIGEASGGNLLDCGEGKDRRCDNAHRVESNDRYTLPIEPYEVATLDYVEPASGETSTLGFATHLAGGEVSMFVIRDGASGDQGANELIRVLDGVVPGASGIATNQVNKEIYVAGRHDPSPHVAVLQVLTDSANGSYTHNPFFNQVDSIDIASEMYAGTDGRGLAVSADGDRLHMVTRSPAALLELDLEQDGLAELTSVCPEPSVVALFDDDHGTDDTSDDESYAFVLCFVTDQVYVIDTSFPEKVVVQSTGAGPHAIAFDRTRRRAFIANFRDSTISIIQIEPPFFDHLRDAEGRVVKIGKPSLPKGHD